MKNKFGFTLLEILIALFILTLVGVITGNGLNLVMRTQSRMHIKYKTFADVQLAMLIMERDIQQIIDRSIIDERGLGRSALIFTGNYLEFTRAGYINPSSFAQRSTLQRVAYKIDDTKLMRITWDVLDRSPKTKAQSEVLLENITDFKWQILPSVNSITNPNPGVVNEQTPSNYFNVGIQIEMNVAGIGYVKRLFPLAVTTFGGQ